MGGIYINKMTRDCRRHRSNLSSDLCVISLPTCKFLFCKMKVLIVLSITIGVCLAQRRPVPQGFQAEYSEDQQPQAAQASSQQYQQEPQSRQNERQREPTTPIPIIRFDKEQGNDGSYKTAWETGNNIFSQEEGYLKELGPDPQEEGAILNAQVQQGSYSYTAPDGQIITVNYVADEKGFHASGDHLPTPPPVSAEVQKGLDLIYAGIKAQAEAAEREAKENPQGLKNQNQIDQDFNGKYRQ
ncbi:cuticle protein 3-like [Anthonomus grandis grandis]|uniref:cuticle protein 3-like n=1 Tax=Anthonomus grandis grandis TaxID=2921223 RepID=UPI00216666BE|nr:cuticle protein 3-like [Anthonomus grandis grandis]